MMPPALTDAAGGYLDSVRRVAGARLAAVYAVGSVALGDWSAKQSNVDLVVVLEEPLDVTERRRLQRAEKALKHAGRPAQLWYPTWEEVSGGPPALREPAELATPLTWAILRDDPAPLAGPDWPVAWSQPGALSSWALDQLRSLSSDKQGLVMRRSVGPLVLQAARLAQAAITGRVLSRSEAGESVTSIVSPRYRRIAVDSVGYRHGAQTSMYWGPFERKYDALALVRELLAAAESGPGS